MRVDDILFFAPEIPFISVNPNRSELISQFCARIDGYYLSPARKLVERDEVFPAGLLLTSVVDALARYDPRYTKPDTRYTDWLVHELPSFGDVRDAKRFYDDFRCGLVHEARIKNGCEFSTAFRETIHLEDGAMVLNPREIHAELVTALKKFSEYLRRDHHAFIKFADRVRADFHRDFVKKKPDANGD
ncbi:MAG: hypothetical protein J2P56_06645 [Verrucomicrobia bacterium]|nr:hypothetical protein [Verrucomicrobiota bacterium]